MASSFCSSVQGSELPDGCAMEAQLGEQGGGGMVHVLGVLKAGGATMLGAQVREGGMIL